MLNTGGTATTGHLTPRGSARAGRRAAPPSDGGGGSNTNSPSTISSPSWNNKHPQQEQQLLQREDSFLSTESESFNISQGSFSLSQNPVATSGKQEEETRPVEPPSAATLAEQEPGQSLSASSKRESGGVRDYQNVNATSPQSPSAASFSKSPVPSWLGDDEGEGNDEDDESFALDSEMGDSRNQQGTPRAAQSGRPNPVAESDNASFFIDSPSVSLSQNPSMILTNSSQQSNLATAGASTTTTVAATAAAAGSTPSGDADQRIEDLPIPLVQETNECMEGNKETPEKEDAAAAAAAEDDATPAIVLHRSSDDTGNQETADTDDGGSSRSRSSSSRGRSSSSSSSSRSSSSDAKEDLQQDEGPLGGDLSPSPSSAEQVTCKPTPPSPRSKKSSSGRGGAPPNLAQLQLEETGEDGHKEESPRAERSKRIDHHLQCHSPTAGNRIGGGLSPRGLGMSPKAMAFGSMRQQAASKKLSRETGQEDDFIHALDGGRLSPRASPRSSPSRHRPGEEDTRPAFSPKSSVQRSVSSPCFTHSGRSVLFGKADSQILFSPTSSTTDVLVPQLTGLTQDQSAMMLQMFLVGGTSAFLAAASPRRGCGSHINHKGAVMGASGRSRGSNAMSASDASSLGLHDDTPLSPVGVGVAQVGQNRNIASPLAGSQSRRRASSVLSLSTSGDFAPLLDVLTQMKQEKRFKLEAECLSAAYMAENGEDGDTRKRREEEEAIAARELLLQQQALRDWKTRRGNENWPQRVKDLKIDLRRIHLARQGVKIERAEKLKRRVLLQEASAQWDSLLRHQESQLAAVHRRHETVTAVSARKSESRYWRDQYFEQNPHLASASRRQRSNSPTMLSSSGLQYWDTGKENEISPILSSVPRTQDRQRMMPKSQSYSSGEGKKRKQSPIPSNEESVRGFGPKQMSDTLQPSPHRQNYSPSQQQRQDQQRKFAAATEANHKPPFNTPNKVQARSLKPATIIPHCPPFGYPIKPRGMKQFDLSSRTSLIHQQNALSEASARKKQQKEQEAAEERYRERKRPSSARTGKGVKYTSPLVPTAAFSTSKKCGGLTKKQEAPVKTLLIKAKNEERSDDQHSLEKGDSAGPLIPQHSQRLFTPLDSMSEQDKQLLFLMTVTRRIQEGSYDADRHRGGEGSPCPDQQPSSSLGAARANLATTSRSPGDELGASCAGAGASAVRGRGSSLKRNSAKKRQQATVVTPLV